MAHIKGDYTGFIKKQGVDTVFIGGCFEYGCVSETVEGSLEEGFDVIVDKDMNILFSSVTDTSNEAMEDIENYLIFSGLN